MDLLQLKIIAALAILLVTILAAWWPFYKRLHGNQQAFPISEALASGVFLGAGLLHMLSDAHNAFAQLGFHYPVAFLLAGVTFLSLLLLEHIGMEINHKRQKNAPIIALLALFMLSVHSLLEGAALGATDNIKELFIIFFAIIIHKWAASFSLAVKINDSSLSWTRGLNYFILFALMTPLGIIMATTVIQHAQDNPTISPIFSALAAGTFIYIGTLHGLKRSVMINQCCNMREFTWVIIGFSMMALAAVWDVH